METQFKYNSEENIIHILKAKNRYDDWVEYGCNFGLTSDRLGGIFTDKPYKYYNIDDNIVNVTIVQNAYRHDVDNIPVFAQLIGSDPSFVYQSEFKLCSSIKSLTTGNLGTSCALSMTIGDQKLLACIGSTTQTDRLINKVKRILNNDPIVNDPRVNITNIQIFVGDLDKMFCSFYKIKNILKLLNIDEKDVYVTYVGMNNISV
jgi:hypothetical protein